MVPPTRARAQARGPKRALHARARTRKHARVGEAVNPRTLAPCSSHSRAVMPRAAPFCAAADARHLAPRRGAHRRARPRWRALRGADPCDLWTLSAGGGLVAEGNPRRTPPLLEARWCGCPGSLTLGLPAIAATRRHTLPCARACACAGACASPGNTALRFGLWAARARRRRLDRRDEHVGGWPVASRAWRCGPGGASRRARHRTRST